MANSAFNTTGVGGGGDGTVTSVGVTSDTLVISGSPVTTNGDINIELPTSATGLNLLYNPAFRFWQRGTSFTGVLDGAAVYTADRWQLQVTGVGGSGFAIRTAGPRTGLYYAHVGRTAGDAAATAISFTQTVAIEDCVGAAGNKISVRVKIKKGADFSATSDELQLLVYSGTGATDVSVNTPFTGATLVLDETLILTASDQTFTFTTAAALGATVTQLGYILTYSPTGVAGADDAFYVAEAKLEIADVPTGFEYPNFTDELQRCMYRYQKTFNIDTAPAQAVGSNTGETTIPANQSGVSVNRTQAVLLRPFMAAIPTVTFYNPVNANAQAYNSTRSQDCSSTAITANSPSMLEWTMIGSAGTIVSDDLGVHWTAEAEIN